MLMLPLWCAFFVVLHRCIKCTYPEKYNHHALDVGLPTTILCVRVFKHSQQGATFYMVIDMKGRASAPLLQDLFASLFVFFLGGGPTSPHSQITFSFLEDIYIYISSLRACLHPVTVGQ